MIWNALLVKNCLLFATIMGLSIDVDHRVAEVDDKFLSIAIDSHVMAERWKNFDFASTRVKNMAKALSPAFLRLGGTAADLVTFKENATPFHVEFIEEGDESCWCSNDKSGRKVCEDLDQALYKNLTNILMTGQDWIDINNFCVEVGWSFLFDVNVLKRNRRGHWR